SPKGSTHSRNGRARLLCPRDGEIPPSAPYEHYSTGEEVRTADRSVLVGDLLIVEVGAAVGDGAPGVASPAAQPGAHEEVNDRACPRLEVSAGKLGDGIPQRVLV